MSIFLLAAAVAAGAPAIPATAPSRGYEAQVTASGMLCLRPTTPAESARLDIPVNHQECRAVTHWEVEGLTVAGVTKG